MNLHILRDLGPFGTNCYIIETSEKNAILIDAPYSAEVISNSLDRLGLMPKKILLTHGHCDHIEALNGLVDKYSSEVYISECDADILASRRLSLAEYFGYDFEPFGGVKMLKDGDVVALDNVSLRVMHTPGHSNGSVCFVAEDCIFTGDTLFRESVGRVDFPGGDWDILTESILKIYSLGKNYDIYPGHGDKSDLASELRINPYLDAVRRAMS